MITNERLLKTKNVIDNKWNVIDNKSEVIKNKWNVIERNKTNEMCNW